MRVAVPSLVRRIHDRLQLQVEPALREHRQLGSGNGRDELSKAMVLAGLRELPNKIEKGGTVHTESKRRRSIDERQ